MKDASHHLRQIQKKVVQDSRKEAMREGNKTRPITINGGELTKFEFGTETDVKEEWQPRNQRGLVYRRPQPHGQPLH